RKLSMKKLGTPMAAGPGRASENDGLEGVGAPLADRVWAGLLVTGPALFSTLGAPRVVDGLGLPGRGLGRLVGGLAPGGWGPLVVWVGVVCEGVLFDGGLDCCGTVTGGVVTAGRSAHWTLATRFAGALTALASQGMSPLAVSTWPVVRVTVTVRAAAAG